MRASNIIQFPSSAVRACSTDNEATRPGPLGESGASSVPAPSGIDALELRVERFARVVRRERQRAVLRLLFGIVLITAVLSVVAFSPDSYWKPEVSQR